MRIAGRTSGGRGEWELAGVQDDITLSDVADREFVVELLPGLRFRTGCWLPTDKWRQQGKPRMRLMPTASNAGHIVYPLTAALLLPKPKREVRATGDGRLTLADDEYAVEIVKFDIVELDANHVVVTPTDLVLTNAGGDQVRVDHVKRMRLVLDLWTTANEKSSDRIAQMLLVHRAACRKGDAQRVLKTGSRLR